MRTIDYNGEGAWSANEILRRYTEYAATLHQQPRDLTPRSSNSGDCLWISPVMDRVIEAIEAGDKAAIAIGVEFIQESQSFHFGKILKSNTARALRRAAKRSELTPQQMQRIRTRVLTMLVCGYVPHEYREYAKLVRAIGLDRPTWDAIQTELGEMNRFAERYRRYFEMLVDQRATQAG